MTNPETILQTKIIEALTKQGWLVLRVNQGRRGGVVMSRYWLPNLNAEWSVELAQRRWPDGNVLTGLVNLQNEQKSGYPDLTAFKDGRCVFLEIKTDSGTPSGSQLMFAEIAKKAGFAHAFVNTVHDVDWHVCQNVNCGEFNEYNKLGLDLHEQWQGFAFELDEWSDGDGQGADIYVAICPNCGSDGVVCADDIEEVF